MIDKIALGEQAVIKYRDEWNAHERAIREREQAFRAEAAKIDISCFSPRMQQAIKEYEQNLERMRARDETDLEYLRRTRPDMTDERRVAYLLWSMAARKSIKEP